MFDVPGREVAYSDPWKASLTDRLAMLVRGVRRVAYLYHHPDNSTFRYRVYNMIQVLNDAGDEVSAAWFSLDDQEFLLHVAELCDALVICRLQYSTLVGRVIDRVRQRGRPVVFDVDDLVFDPKYVELIMVTLNQDLGKAMLWDYWYAYTGRIRATLDLCDRAITTNRYLADRISEASGAIAGVVPNFMNNEQLEISQTVFKAKERLGFKRNGRLHLGYFSGSPSHDNDFAIVLPTLVELLDECSELTLRLAGYISPAALPARHAERVEFMPFTDFLNLQRHVGATEINLVPLQMNTFTNCKSELKYFEAAATGTVTVATPTYTYANAIEDGRNGFLSGEHEWDSRIRRLIAALADGGEHYRTIAIEARNRSEDIFSTKDKFELISGLVFGNVPGSLSSERVQMR